MKLNVLLAKTDHSTSIFKRLLTDYVHFFKTQQGQFLGVRKTYSAREGTLDEPSWRGNVTVVTTVPEKLGWLEETAKDHVNNLFSVEATNASGTAKVELVVDGINFGMMSSLELLRLNSMIDAGEFDEMYRTLPVRSDAETWDKSTDPLYVNREVYQKPLQSGVKKGTVKEQYILPDPNMTKDNVAAMGRYIPQIAVKEQVTEHGDYTVQHFSGETSHLERAMMLKRKSKLKEAVIEALKKANEVEAVPSELTAEKLFGYLHRGSIA